MLAVAITALLLMIWGQEGNVAAQEDTEPGILETVEVPESQVMALEESVETIRQLIATGYAFLPRLFIMVVLIGLAAVAGKIISWILRKTLRTWERGEAMAALIRISLYLLAVGAGLSVLAGDARALVGSVGLVGLALSWALQTPIESFTGWILNSFRSYYRVGDRIEVGEVFGDVFRIDVLTTTVWEAGGPGKAVQGAQPTGAMITFPNWEVLRSNIVNYTRDFPFVWDEVVISISSESDMAYTMRVLRDAAVAVIGDRMAVPIAQYQGLLQRARLAFDVAEEPLVFVTLAEAWTDCTVRYLVEARARRRWASELNVELSNEIAKPEHKGKIFPAYPRTEIKLRREWDQPDRT